MAKKRHLVYLDSKQEKFLDEIIERKNLEVLDSTSKLMRFIIEDYHTLITKKANPDVRLNYISKEVSMILNLVVSMSHTMKATHMTNENVLQYWQAHQEVERVINENKLNKRNGFRKKKKPSPTIKAKLEQKIFDESYYDQIGIGFAENDESLGGSQEENQLEFGFNTYEYKEATDDDYIEVTTDKWVKAKY